MKNDFPPLPKNEGLMNSPAKPGRGRPRKANGLRECRLTVRLTAKGRDALIELRKTPRGMISAAQVIESLILQALESERLEKKGHQQQAGGLG